MKRYIQIISISAFSILPGYGEEDHDHHDIHVEHRIRSGHADIMINYDADEGLHFYVMAGDDEHHDEEDEHEEDHEDEGEDEHDHEHGEELETDEVAFVVGAMSSRFTVPANAAFDFLGNTGNIVYVLPQSENPTLPFLGLNTEELSSAEWPEGLVIELVDAEGPGWLKLFTLNEFSVLTLWWDSTEVEENILTQGAGIHAHHNWAFSSEGEYHVEVRARGMYYNATTGSLTEVSSEVSTLIFIVGGAAAYYDEVLTDHEDGWIEEAAEGWIYTGNWQWTWRPSLGWWMAAGDGGHERWYYDVADDEWYWTREDIFPHKFAVGAQEWR